MSLSRQYYLLAGSALTLTCDITVNPNVNTPIIVYVSWNMTDQSIMSSGDTGRDSDSGGRCGSDRGNIGSSGSGDFDSRGSGSGDFNSSGSGDFNSSGSGTGRGKFGRSAWLIVEVHGHNGVYGLIGQYVLLVS